MQDCIEDVVIYQTGTNRQPAKTMQWTAYIHDLPCIVCKASIINTMYFCRVLIYYVRAWILMPQEMLNKDHKRSSSDFWLQMKIELSDLQRFCNCMAVVNRGIISNQIPKEQRANQNSKQNKPLFTARGNARKPDFAKTAGLLWLIIAQGLSSLTKHREQQRKTQLIDFVQTSLNSTAGSRLWRASNPKI